MEGEAKEKEAAEGARKAVEEAKGKATTALIAKEKEVEEAVEEGGRRRRSVIKRSRKGMRR